MAQLSIRRATSADTESVAALAAQTFVESYGDTDDPADIASYVAEYFSESEIAGLIESPGSTVLLAETGGRPCGYAHLRIGRAPDCIVGPKLLELSRLYLVKTSIGTGAGSALMNAVLAEARTQQRETVWLGVYSINQHAIAFYERHGFRKVGTYEFVLGNAVYTDPVYSRPVG